MREYATGSYGGAAYFCSKLLVELPLAAVQTLILTTIGYFMVRCVNTLLGPGFQLAARWNRLGETVKTRKTWRQTGEKWARYGLKRVKEGS